MCVTICGRFCPDEGVVAGYDNRIRVKYTAKWGVQIAGMIFQTHSRTLSLQKIRAQTNFFFKGNVFLFTMNIILLGFQINHQNRRIPYIKLVNI